MLFAEYITILNDILTNLGPRDLLDIAIVTVLIYIALIFIKQTHSFFILTTIIALSGISYFSGYFNLHLTQQLFQPFLTFFLIILIIVFQRELRRFFEWFSVSGRKFAIQKRIFISEDVVKNIQETVTALVNDKVGALIVITGDHPIEHSIDGGHRLDGRVSTPLLLSIFDTRTPGHDGAVIISDNRIKYFGVHLPLAQSFKNLNKEGTRHRAAVGITEETDALAIVVSEEHGTVSVSLNGLIKRISKETFEEALRDFMKEKISAEKNKSIWRYLVLRNWIEKISSLILALILWVILTI